MPSVLLTFWAVFLLLAPWYAVDADEFAGKVVGISDGDAITVLTNRSPIRVRLSGIDCPETGQDFGTRAKSATSKLAFGKVVTIRQHGHDRHGRIVADMILPDGRNVKPRASAPRARVVVSQVCSE
jgi:endonuclease YncB( thermonuclease family)